MNKKVEHYFAVGAVLALVGSFWAVWFYGLYKLLAR